MAINRNNTLPNRHHIICGQSGSGKTTFMVQNPEIKKAKRLLIWDPYQDHKCSIRVTTPNALKKFLAGALRRNVGFKVALSIKDDSNEKEIQASLIEFFDIVWRVADGEKITHVIVEEVAECYDTSGKAKGRAGQVFRAGRSYGLILYPTTQSVAEVPKTLVKQCGTKVVFYHNDNNDMKRAADLAGHRVSDIGALKVGQYYIRKAGDITGDLKRTKKL